MGFILGCMSFAGGACVIIAGLVAHNFDVVAIGSGSFIIGLSLVLTAK